MWPFLPTLCNCKEYEHLHGHMLMRQPVAGDAEGLLMVNIFALLQTAYASTAGYRHLIDQALAIHGNSYEKPWKLVLYGDEVVPGNVLATENRRKVWMWYFSFLQFSRVALSKEESWLTLCARRSSTVSAISGGVSQMTAALLKGVFCNDVCDPAENGLVLQRSDGSTLTLFFRFGALLADGGAHKHIWGCKCDSGHRSCMICRNFVTERSGLRDEEDEEILVCSTSNYDELDFAEDDDVLRTIDRLMAKKGELSAASFKLWERACGFVYDPHALLFDASLRKLLCPVSQYHHDWMHGLVVKGVCQTLLHALLTQPQQTCLYEQIRQYVHLWQQPKCRDGDLSKLFSPKRKEANVKAHTFKCSASEMLGILPIVAYFVQVVLLPVARRRNCQRLQQACEALLLVADLVDLLLAASQGRMVEPERILIKVKALLNLCEHSGFKQLMHSKFHWMVHYHQELKRFKTLLTCWVHERKHKLVKCYGAAVFALQHFEKSVISEILAHDLELLKQDGIFDTHVRLANPHPATKNMMAFLRQFLEDYDLQSAYSCVSLCLSPAGSCSRGDFVLLAQCEAGEVLNHFEVRGACLTLLTLYNRVSYDSSTFAATWRKAARPVVLVNSTEVKVALQFRRLSNDEVKSLMPFGHRL